MFKIILNKLSLHDFKMYKFGIDFGFIIEAC